MPRIHFWAARLIFSAISTCSSALHCHVLKAEATALKCQCRTAWLSAARLSFAAATAVCQPLRAAATAPIFHIFAIFMPFSRSS